MAIFDAGTLLSVLLAANPASPQVVPPAPVVGAAVDPAQLAAARKLIDVILPPDKRDAMIEMMVRPMMATMRQSFEQAPDFRKVFTEKPAMRAVMMKFLDDETERSLAITKANLPMLIDAMAYAYARRFNARELADLDAFFHTPSGASYVAKSPTIMADPDVMNAQRVMMTKSLEGFEARVKVIAASLIEDAKKQGAK